MKNKAHNLSSYKFSSNDKILIDANIWLYLFPPPASPKPNNYIEKYSKAFHGILSAKSEIVVDVLVVSEYLNRYARIEYQTSGSTVPFKEFRNSSDFKIIGNSAAIFAKKIMSLGVRHDHHFSSVDIDSVLKDYANGLGDFNDGLLIKSCIKNNWKILTNDGDFTQGGIEVITVNKNLLSACA